MNYNSGIKRVIKRTLHILFINSVRIYGGGEVWMISAMEQLMRRDHRVILLCRPDAKIKFHAKKRNIEVIPLRIRGDFDPITIITVALILREKKIDVILTNMDKELRFSGIAARLAKVKAVICRKGIDCPLKNKLRYRFTYNWLASTIVANSQATKATLLQNAPWLNPERIHVIYNGIDPDLFSKENTKDLRAKLGIPEKDPLIGFVGRLNIQKGIVYLLQAFEQVLDSFPTAHLLIVGEGDLRDEIEKNAKEKAYSKNIHLIGFRDDIPNIMRTIDLLVLPSLWEGFGIVLIEAMAAKKPCVTTKISSMPEIVKDGETGIIVPPKNSTVLARAIITLISNKRLAMEMGEQGKMEVLKKFTLNKMIKQYEELFYLNLFSKEQKIER